MVLVKNWKFFHLFILGKTEHENVFYETLNRESDFLG